MCHTIATKFIRHDLPGLATMATHKSPEKALGCYPIPTSLQEHIYHLSILVNGSPEIMLLTFDLYKYLINEECIAEALMLSFQPPSVQ